MNRRGFFSALAAPLLAKSVPVTPFKVGKLTQTIVVSLDGRKLAETITPQLSEYVRRQQV